MSVEGMLSKESLAVSTTFHIHWMKSPLAGVMFVQTLQMCGSVLASLGGSRCVHQLCNMMPVSGHLRRGRAEDNFLKHVLVFTVQVRLARVPSSSAGPGFSGVVLGFHGD